jgi:ATP-binding cassette subfamily C protein LapB
MNANISIGKVKKEGTNAAAAGSRQQPVHDPLLSALLILVELKHKTCSVVSLTAGLPLVNQRLTPELFIRAARRANLSAKLVKQRLRRVIKHNLPAVIFLKNGNIWVLTHISETGQAEVIKPETGTGCSTIDLKELGELYAGYMFFVDEPYRFDEQDYRVAPQQKKQKHWLWAAMSRVAPIYGEVLVGAALINFFALASPLFIMNVYDRVVPNQAIETLWVLAVGAIIVFVFEFILRNLRAFFVDVAGKSVDVKLSADTFEQVMGLQMSSRPSSIGPLVNTVQSFSAFRDFIASLTVNLLIDVPFVILFVIVMGMIGGAVVWVPIVAIPLMLLASYVIHKPLSKSVGQNYSHSAAKHAVLIESLAGIETIKGSRAEGVMQHQWELITRAAAKLGVKLRMITNASISFSTLMQHLVTVFIVIVGVYRISGGHMTTGALIACVILSGRTIAPIAQIALLLTRYQETKASIDSLDKVMGMPTERPAEKQFIHRLQLRGGVEFKRVNFAYAEDMPTVLQDVSFKLNPGERVGFIGRIGAGKSTIIKLILKFYVPNQGKILIDGTEINQLDPAELRHYIGYIPQDVVLFHGTVRDNIALGASYVSDEAILRAAQLSGVDTFVNNDPNGFDRRVSERGCNLSSGQRQAIAIARALLMNPPILVIDEPCNSMDDLLINRFISRLNHQMKDKTIILATHRSQLLKLVDRLIVVDAGRIVADGAKDEVLKQVSTHQIKMGDAKVSK